MVDPGEFVTATLRREFAEEALDLEGADEKTKHAIEKRIDEAFANGQEVRCIVIREIVSHLLKVSLLLSFTHTRLSIILLLLLLRCYAILLGTHKLTDTLKADRFSTICSGPLKSLLPWYYSTRS